jgi:hypothetical protein
MAKVSEGLKAKKQAEDEGFDGEIPLKDVEA